MNVLLTNCPIHQNFSEIVINPCRKVRGSKDGDIEKCPADKAEFFSVYTIIDNLHFWIADTETEEEADQFLKVLKSLCENYKPI